MNDKGRKKKGSEREVRERHRRDIFFTINSTRVDCQRERRAKELQRHEHKGIAISVMEINEIIGTASTRDVGKKKKRKAFPPEDRDP